MADGQNYLLGSPLINKWAKLSGHSTSGMGKLRARELSLWSQRLFWIFL